MPITLDTSAAMRGTNDLRRLVEAIVAATEHDEADWLEWKSVLDLATKEGCFQVARAVLGMANRSPERAQLTCEGLGYAVVGAQAGSVVGVSSIDPATLDQMLEPYLGGAAGPRFTPTYVAMPGGVVLVVTVEPPRAGDPIFTLRKETEKYRGGTVFVRKSGRTVIADAADMDALQRRLTRGVQSSADLEVAVVGDVPLSWFDGSRVEAEVERWAAERASRLVAEAQATVHTRPSPEPPVAEAGSPDESRGEEDHPRRRMVEMTEALGRLHGDEDTRTLDQYVEEVEEWRQRLIACAIEDLPRRYVDAGHGVVELEIRNPTGRFLPDVELELHFDFDPSRGLDEVPEGIDLPSEPRKYGERTIPRSIASLIDTRYLNTVMPSLSSYDGVIRRTWVEDGSIRIMFAIGDLRQHAKDVSDEVYLILGGRPDDGVLRGTWRATVRDVEGVLSGTLEVPVAAEPVDIIGVLQTKGE